MIEAERIVSFMAQAGHRRADVSFDSSRNEPYIVEYYVIRNIAHEWCGHTVWKTEEEAEKAAMKYTFGENDGSV